MEDKINLIHLLNEAGFNVLFIDNDVYIVSKWVPADGKSYFFHSLTGILITKEILNKFSTYNETNLRQGINAMITVINKEKERSINFSSNFSWKIYLFN